MLLYYWSYLNHWQKLIRCLAKPPISSFSPTCLINSIIHEHSHKILYITAFENMTDQGNNFLRFFKLKRNDFLSQQNWSSSSFYRKFPKYSDTQKICCNHSKIWTMWLYHRVMSPNDADGMANSVDPDQTAEQSDLGLQCLPRAYLSENLGSLRYNEMAEKPIIIC